MFENQLAWFPVDIDLNFHIEYLLDSNGVVLVSPWQHLQYNWARARFVISASHRVASSTDT
jgi:hypothetical protein